MRASLLLVVLMISFSLHAAAPVTRFVDINNPNPVSPYTNWATAATNIQDAINSSSSSDIVLVSNGVYRTGAVSFAGTNRILINNSVTVPSVNGKDVTIIEGEPDPNTTNGPLAVRCVAINSGSLIGFTLTNGATTSGENGGVVRCGVFNGFVSDCTMAGNYAAQSGGAVYGSGLILSNCVFTH